MNKKYDFKRSFYYEAEKAIEDNSISFILGARKCGKTVCMRQLKDTLENAVYIDIKAECDTDEKCRDVVNRIMQSIANDEKIVYLIDEVTYLAFPDKSIAKIAGEYSEYDNHNTKIVFSGSQSNALEFWGHIACGGNAAYIRTSFLTYPEWLAYKGITEVSEKTYLDFLFNSGKFNSSFKDIKDYLQGCLDETVVSNNKAAECVMGSGFTEELDVEMLLDVLYASLVKLHNHTNYKTFSNPNYLSETISYNFGITLNEEEERRISKIIGGRYKSFKEMQGYNCKSAMQFLTNCGLTTLTYISDEMKADPYMAAKFLKDANELYLKPQIFSKFNLTIDYPIFCVDLIQNVLKDRQINELPKALLGSVVECHVRSLLPKTGAFEYRSNEGVEIDYISNQGYGMEISISNKRIRDVNLNELPEGYEKILLTKNMTDNVGDIQRIPYYQFIYDNSVGKELVEELIQKEKEH